MTGYRGPAFTVVDTIDVHELERQGGFRPRQRPLLVKGAVTRWPAWTSWSFTHLAGLTRSDGSEVITQFQNGLVEQGTTREPLRQSVPAYLRALETASARLHPDHRPEAGLCPDAAWQRLTPGQKFFLNWEYLRTFQANKPYLAQWDILREFPRLKRDFAIRSLWKGLRWTWEYVFIGPAQTVTGLHYDFPNNWFCQVRGVKEVVLFPPGNDAHLSKSRKYDWGATLSDVDIMRLHEQPLESDRLLHAEGIYARVEAGDALFIPKRTWHGVVALEPSISLAVFGLTIPEIVIGGGASETRSLLHKLGLYRNGNCTCHRTQAHEPQESRKGSPVEAFHE